MLHAAAQRAVAAGHGQHGQQLVVDFLVDVGMAEQGHEQLGRRVVVERESAAVGHVVVVGVEAQVAYEAVHLPGGLFAPGIGVSFARSYLIKERFGAEVVALLHHGPQDLADGVRAAGDGACR